MKSLLRKILILAIVMAVVTATGWFGRKAYKKIEKRQFIAQANQFIIKKDWRNTSLCLQRVLQMDPLNLEASKMMAALLDSSGSTNALLWRIRTAKLEPDNVTNKFLWAQTAIRMQNLESAAEALSKIAGRYKNSAEYDKLAGALAWKQGRADEAQTLYSAAVRLEPTNQASLLNLETILLASTNQAVAAAASLSLEREITNANLRPLALQHLLRAAVARRETSTAVTYAKEIVGLATATFAVKIQYLQLLRETKSANYAPWLASLKMEASHSPPQAFALGQWLAKNEKSDSALRWLQALPLDIQTTLPVPLVITDCQIDLKDWNGVLTSIDKKDWGDVEYYRLALAALAHRSLGENSVSENCWRKTLLSAAHAPDRLSRLVQVTAAWGWIPEKTELLREIIDEFPGEQWAINQLTEQLYLAGDTGGLQKLFSKTHAADPSDVRLKNNLSNILLLRKSELDEANLLAKEAYETDTNNPFFVSTYAYSLALQNKTEAAVKVLDNLKPEYLKIPSVAAYYGVVQAQSGHKELAHESFDNLETAKLLPEEKEMIRQAKTKL